MPVAFLQRVGRDYTFHFTASAGPFAGEHTNVWLNYMILDQRTFRALIGLSTDRLGSGSQIGTAYHEATHAYLDLRDSEPAFARVIRDGVEHYRDAPMANG